MERDCNSFEEYNQAIKDLGKEPIIGKHRIGVLDISVNHLRWTVQVGSSFTLTGTATKGPVIRAAVDKACRKWLADSKYRPLR